MTKALPARVEMRSRLLALHARALAVLFMYATALALLSGALVPRVALATDTIAAPSDDGASFSSSELRPDAADPCMLKVGDTYYLFSTTSDLGIPYYTSTDLKTWTLAGNALSCSALEGTGLAGGSNKYKAVWAPEVRERTVGGRTTYVLTYTAADYGNSRYRICVAEATKIAPGAFSRPKVLDTGSVKNAIDSDLYFEGEDIWLYFKNEDEYHTICVERLNPDWSRKTNPQTVLKMDQMWESWTIEGPWMLKWGSTYYLMYSSGGYTTSHYCIGYATASSPDGPFTKVTTGSPLVRSQMGVIGPGHNSTMMVAEGEIYLVYHSLHKEGQVDRKLMVDRMGIDDDGRMFVNFAGFGRQPLPSGTQGFYQVSSDDLHVSAHGVESLSLTDVVNGNADAVDVESVDTSTLSIEVEDGYMVSDLWLFGARKSLSGTADLLINGEHLVSGYRLSSTAVKLTLPNLNQHVHSIEVRLSATQGLSEVLLVSWGERWSYTPLTEADLPEGRYLIQSALKNDMVLDNAGNSKKPGGNVLIWKYKGASNQVWNLSYDEAGRATFTNGSSGLALDVTGGSTKKGTNIEQWTPTGGNPQKWCLQSNSDGTCMLVSAIGWGSVADVAGASSSNGANVLLWTQSGKTNQRWRMIPLDPAVSTEGMADIADGYYTLSPAAAPGLCLDVSGASLANGGNLITWTKKGALNQLFEITRQDSGFYVLRNVNSGKVVDVDHSYPISGTNVLQWTGKGAPNQEWAIYEASEGGYTLRNVGTGLMLDLTGGNTSPGTNVEGYRANGSIAQRWYLDESSPWESGLALAAENDRVIPEGTYSIGSSMDANQVLDVSGASRSAGANVLLWRYKGTSNQHWDISYDENGFATIVSSHSGMALAFGNAQKESNVTQATSDGSVRQKWVIVDNGDGTVTFVAAIDTRFALDAYGRKCANGTNIQLYAQNGGSGQRFVCTAV